MEDGICFIYSAIYASNEVDERQELWQSLHDTFVSFNLVNRPWMVNGDFNEILSPHESSNNLLVNSTTAMRNFGECLSNLSLFDMASQGPKFTWSNHRPSDPVSKKLDRCLINDLWLFQFPSSHCIFAPPEFSDHTPGHVRLVTPAPPFGTRPFKFFNFLT